MFWTRVRSKTASSIAVLACAAATLLVASAPAHAAITQGIQGTISLSGGLTLSSGTVAAYDATSTSTFAVDTAFASEDDGSYSLSLPAGQYWVRFSATGGPDPIAPQWWGGAATRGDSTMVTIPTDNVATLDLQLTVGGRINGTIATDTSGEDHDDTTVTAYLPDATYPGGYANIAHAYASEDGTGDYQLRGMPSGAYLLHYYSLFSKKEGWYPNGKTTAGATAVTVTAPTVVNDVDPTLFPAGTISGVAKAATTGAAQDHIDIQLYEWDGDSWNWDDYTYQTGPDGKYSIAAPAGQYRVGFQADDARQLLEDQYWKNATDVGHGQTVAVTVDHASTGIDASLARTPPISNKVPPVILGNHTVGTYLSGSIGTWTPDYLEYSTQWLRDGVVIPGENGQTYHLVRTADLGRHLTLRVTASRTGLASKSVTSAAVTIPGPALTLGSRAKVTGKLKVGKILHAVPPRCSPAASATYQWLRNGKAIGGAGARKASYKLVRADRGKRLGVRITLTRTGYAITTRTVTVTGKVK